MLRWGIRSKICCGELPKCPLSESGNPSGKTDMNILEQIIADKRLEVAERKKRRPLKDLQAEISGIGNRPDFVEALRAAPMGLIAEVKRRSPSAGLIRDPFDPAAIARDYESNGASAVSCLMDNKYFGGGAEDFSAARRAIRLPRRARCSSRPRALVREDGPNGPTSSCTRPSA